MQMFYAIVVSNNFCVECGRKCRVIHVYVFRYNATTLAFYHHNNEDDDVDVFNL